MLQEGLDGDEVGGEVMRGALDTIFGGGCLFSVSVVGTLMISV